MTAKPPPPPPDWDASGWAKTGRARLRPSWFGIAILEEEAEYLDGTRKWQRCTMPQPLRNSVRDVF